MEVMGIRGRGSLQVSDLVTALLTNFAYLTYTGYFNPPSNFNYYNDQLHLINRLIKAMQNINVAHGH